MFDETHKIFALQKITFRLVISVEAVEIVFKHHVSIVITIHIYRFIQFSLTCFTLFHGKTFIQHLLEIMRIVFCSQTYYCDIEHFCSLHLLCETQVFPKLGVLFWWYTTTPNRADIKTIRQSRKANSHRVCGSPLRKPHKRDFMVTGFIVAQILIIQITIGLWILDGYILNVGITSRHYCSNHHQSEYIF